MRSTTRLLAAAAAFSLALLALPPEPEHLAAAVRDAGQPPSQAGQPETAVTIYNSDLALVRDVRDLVIQPGEHELAFADIAATVNPATVHLRSLTDPGALTVLEQNYEYDLLEPEKLLRKYVGRDVTLVRTRTDNGTTRQEEVTATLVSYNNGPIWKIGPEYVTGLTADHLRFPELPANLYSRPTLVWRLANRGPARHRVEASYLAGGLRWNADYVLTVGRDDKAADLGGWVTVVNRSGTAFRDAAIQLVAGQLNRVRPAAQKMALEAMAAPRAAGALMAQEAFSEYHLYSPARRTTIANDETKQLALLAGAGVPVEKRYVVNGEAFYYRNRNQPGAAIKDDVETFYRFRNDQRSGLGMPMPAGVIRVYQADTKGSLHFVGEDHIDHTPKDETIDLKIGTAFDVVCERKQTDFEKIADNVYEVEFAVVLRNHKAVPVTIQVNEPVGGTWRMVRHSHPWEKTGAWAAAFTVPVGADGTATLSYRVRVTS